MATTFPIDDLGSKRQYFTLGCGLMVKLTCFGPNYTDKSQKGSQFT